jgi:hypothetical protein
MLLAAGVYVVMCLTFLALWLGPLYLLDRAERRRES